VATAFLVVVLVTAFYLGPFDPTRDPFHKEAIGTADGSDQSTPSGVYRPNPFDVAFLDVLYRRRELYPNVFREPTTLRVLSAHLRNGFLGLRNPADIVRDPWQTSGPLERVYTKVSHDCVKLPTLPSPNKWNTH